MNESVFYTPSSTVTVVPPLVVRVICGMIAVRQELITVRSTDAASEVTARLVCPVAEEDAGKLYVATYDNVVVPTSEESVMYTSTPGTGETVVAVTPPAA